jgi:hypothetical protein
MVDLLGLTAFSTIDIVGRESFLKGRDLYIDLIQ